MSVKAETWEIAPKFDWKNLRENYIAGKVFNVGALVESLNTGMIGRVIRMVITTSLLSLRKD